MPWNSTTAGIGPRCCSISDRGEAALAGGTKSIALESDSAKRFAKFFDEQFVDQAPSESTAAAASPEEKQSPPTRETPAEKSAPRRVSALKCRGAFYSAGTPSRPSWPLCSAAWARSTSR